MSGINSSTGQGLNLVEDFGERSDVDVEALQCLGILIDESLNLCSVLCDLRYVGTFEEFVQLSLNGLNSL